MSIPPHVALNLKKQLYEKLRLIIEYLEPHKIENMQGRDLFQSGMNLIEKIRLLEGESTQNFYVITRGADTDKPVQSTQESGEDHQGQSQVQSSGVREEVREDNVRSERAALHSSYSIEPAALLRGAGVRAGQVSSLGNASEASRQTPFVPSQEDQRIGALSSSNEQLEDRDQGSGQTGSIERSKPRRGRPRRVRGYEAGSVGQSDTSSLSGS